MPVGRVVPYPVENRHGPDQKPEEHLPEEVGSKEKKGQASATEGGASAMEEGARPAGGRQSEGTGGGVGCGNPQRSHARLQGQQRHWP